jgi:hypothetical protein
MVFHRRDAESPQRTAEIFGSSRRNSAKPPRLGGEIYLGFHNWQLRLIIHLTQLVIFSLIYRTGIYRARL